MLDHLTFGRTVSPEHSQCSVCGDVAPQHFLNFLPEPQGQGSLRPTLADRIGSRRGKP
jgi:hypothetical protein